jgi:hypothetical protein
MKHSYKTKRQKKVKEGHLEEGKIASQQKGRKAARPRKEQGKAQIHKTPPETNSS